MHHDDDHERDKDDEYEPGTLDGDPSTDEPLAETPDAPDTPAGARSDDPDPFAVTPDEEDDPDDARPTGRASLVSLDEAIRPVERWPDPLVTGLCLLVLVSWPLARFMLADDEHMRAPVTAGIWLVCGLLLAVGVVAAGALAAGREHRTPRATNTLPRIASILSGLLAVPALSLCATLPLLLPSFVVLPLHHMVAMVAAALGAAWLTWSSLRRTIDALRGPSAARAGRGTARWLTRSARALHGALPDTGDRPTRWSLYGRGRADARLETELWGLHRVGIQRGVIELVAERGHLPRAVADRVREESGDAVHVERLGGRHLVVSSRSAARAGRVAGQLLTGWSGRERLGASDEAGERESVAGGARTDRVTARAIREPAGIVRPVLAGSLVAAAVWELASQTVIFPVWEASTLVALVALGLSVAAALVHAWPGEGLRRRVVRDAVLGASLREVLDLMWTLGAPVDDVDVTGSTAQSGGAVRTLHIASVVLSARLTVWWAGAGPQGVVHGERLELWAPAGSDETPGAFAASALRGLRGVLRELGWQHRVDVHDDGGQRVTMVTERALGTGQGAWRELTWRLGDEAVLVEDRSPRSRLLPVSSSGPTDAVQSRVRGGGRGWLHLVSCVAVAGLVWGLPRVDAAQFESAPVVGQGELSESAALASSCPEAGETTWESLRALRCLANAAGQEGRRLEALDWSVLLDPVATAVDAMTEIAALGSLASCEEVGARAQTLAEAGAVDFAIATLSRYRKEPWATLHFFWPSRLVRDGRRLDWSRLESALERCQGTLGRLPVSQARQLYRLSGMAFGGLYRQ